jgi:hypothetical protein
MSRDITYRYDMPHLSGTLNITVLVSKPRNYCTGRLVLVDVLIKNQMQKTTSASDKGDKSRNKLLHRHAM